MPEPQEQQRLPEGGPGPRAAWLLLGLAYLGVALVRLRLLGAPLERDEGEYAYFGQLLLQGEPPFRMAYTLKLPGTQLAYAAAMAVFGQTATALRLGLLAANAATTALLFLAGRRLLGTAGGLVAGVAFAWLSTSTAMLALLGHATHYVVLCATGGLLLLLRAADGGRLRTFAGSGLFLGLATLMKQPGAIFLLFALGWLAWRRRAEGAGARRLLAEAAALAGGAALPVVLVLAWVALGGSFSTFWFWVVRYASEYSTSLSPSDGLRELTRNGGAILSEAWLLWALAGAGLVAAAWPRWDLPGRSFLLALPLFSFVGVSAGLYYRPHYFILLLPAAALLAGVAARFAVARAADVRGARAAAWAALGIAAAGGAQTLWSQRVLLLERSPVQVARALYGANPFPESPEIARYLADRTGPADRIAVFGSEPQIYFYARRRAATGHVYTYGLMERHPLAHAMQEQMAAEIDSARPAYFVWALVPTSWLMRPSSDPWILGWAERFVVAGYQLVGQVQILGPDRTEYFWDDFAPRAPERQVNRVLVFRRRDFVPAAGGGTAR